MRPEFSSALLRDLMRAARAGEPHEICGILLGREGRVIEALPTRNVAAQPRTSFEIDPAALIAAHRDARLPGAPLILGWYHSHPGGEPLPSPRDAECAAPDGMLWLILTGGSARLWRAVSDGAVHNRFDPMRFDLRNAKRVDKGVALVRLPDAGEELECAV